MEEPWIGARGREAMLLDAGDLDGDGVAEIVVPHYLADFVLSAEQTRGDRRGFVWLRSRNPPFDPQWDAFDVRSPGREIRSQPAAGRDAGGVPDIPNTEENDNAPGGNPGLGLVWYENPAGQPR